MQGMASLTVALIIAALGFFGLGYGGLVPLAVMAMHQAVSSVLEKGAGS